MPSAINELAISPSLIEIAPASIASIILNRSMCELSSSTANTIALLTELIFTLLF